MRRGWLFFQARLRALIDQMRGKTALPDPQPIGDFRLRTKDAVDFLRNTARGAESGLSKRARADAARLLARSRIDRGERG
jgi:hypothetical protein